MRIIRNSDCRAMPWRNGGGTTTEVICDPPGGDPFNWRVSVADVTASGPFSRFADYDRHIAVIEGRGMILQFADGRTEMLDPMKPFSFRGDDETAGNLQHGPVRDLNLIVRRGYGYGTLTFRAISDHQVDANAQEGQLLIYVVQGSFTADASQLAAGDAVHLEPRQRIQLAGLGWLAMCAVTAEGRAVSPANLR
jgi:uncharacterized protein